jgi:DNA repair photolyase
VARRFLYQPKGRANETHAFVAGRTDGLWAINHASGCSHGCRYPCYAWQRQQTLRGRTYDQWRQPIVYEEAPTIVQQELKRAQGVKDVELCFTTDPYMYGNLDMTTTSNALLRLLTDQGIKVTVLTKGDLTDAIDHLRGIVPQRVRYGITLASLEEHFRCTWEPGAAPIEQRIKALRLKHDQGHDTWLSIEPYPPPQLSTQNPSEILKAVPFVNKAILGRWNYADLKGYDGWYTWAAGDFMDTCKQLGIKGYVKADITAAKLKDGEG